MLRRFDASHLAAAALWLVLGAVMACASSAQEPHTKATPPAGVHHPTESETRVANAEQAISDEIPNPVKAEPALVVWTTVVFFGLLFLLGKYAWTPLMTALHDREHGLERTLEETERARHESEKILAEHRALMAKAGDDVRAILDKARADAQLAADQIVKAAQAEAEASRQRAVRDINTAKDQALTEIWTKSAEVAVSVAGRVLSKQLGEDDHRRLLDAAILELPGVIDSTTRSPVGSHA